MSLVRTGNSRENRCLSTQAFKQMIMTKQESLANAKVSARQHFWPKTE